MNNDIKKINAVRHNEYYAMQKTFDELYKKSQNGCNFTNLMEIIRSEDNIRLAYRNIKSNKGCYTAGIDNKTIDSIKNKSDTEVINSIQNKLNYYKPKPVKRILIPKNSGGTRPLGIPTIDDRIIQQCIRQVMEPICEAKFFKHSYGFRPDRSTKHAIARSYQLMQRSKLHFVVDVDIKGFFDNVNHSKLIKQMWNMGFRDKQLICIIKEIIKSPIILPNGTKELVNKGTPQGGIISPLLSNIVLNELDWWIASQWECMPTKRVKDQIRHDTNGCTDRSASYLAFKTTTTLKEMFVVRYADDFKIFCRKRSDANKVLIAVTQWLKERLKLNISQEKSGITNLKKHSTEFLGIKMKVHKKGEKMVVESHMTDKAIENVKETLKRQIKCIQHPKNMQNIASEINKYNALVIGIHEYYKMATHIRNDCDAISKSTRTQLVNRIEGIKKTGEINKHGIIWKKYGKSKELRFFFNSAIVPISYCQTWHPLNIERTICRYTEIGRSTKHKKLGVSINKIIELMKHEIKDDQSIEYTDNRISLYAAQNGKCAITGLELDVQEIHCHHKTPRKLGGSDAYKNLIIINKIIHMLIHATKQETIQKYLSMITNATMLVKVNKLRILCENEPITITA